MSFDDQITAAKAVVRSQDVQVLLDIDLADERDRLIEAISEASEDGRLTRKSKAGELREQLEGLQGKIADAAVTLRFRRLPGRVWGEIASAHKPREGYELDVAYGYNIDAVCVNAILYRRNETGPAYAFRVEDGVEVELTEDQWFDLFDAVSGGEFRDICIAVLTLNVIGPRQMREAAVKASGATARSAKK